MPNIPSVLSLVPENPDTEIVYIAVKIERNFELVSKLDSERSIYFDAVDNMFYLVNRIHRENFRDVAFIYACESLPILATMSKKLCTL